MKPSILRRATVKIARRILARSGPLARTIRYPVRRLGPAYRPVMGIARDAGMGDVVMITSALRELKRRNPNGRLKFYTNFGELVEGLPYIDEVLPFSDRPGDAIFVEYTNLMPSNVHIAKLMGDRLGIEVTDTRPDCVVDPDMVARFRNAWRDLPRPWIAILRRASRFTPNKDWPAESWAALTTDMCRSATIIELGAPEDEDVAAGLANYIDLRGATTVKELAGAVAAADIYVGPVSGPLHIAAAVGTPAVAIIGGYEHPVNAHYPGNTELYTPLPCAPCWLREPCPFGLKCLHAITSDQVARAIRATWDTLQAGTASSG